MNEDDPLEDFTPREISLNGVAKVVHVAGTGPGVIVMTEMPGISPHVARFARWVRDAGFTVYMPSLFGRDGAVAGAEEGAATFRRACMSAEFRALGGNRSSPVTAWLRSLAGLAHAECAGPGVGAIGMCFTGNFALTMMLEPAMLAPVLSQPSLPLDEPSGLEISAQELAAVRARLDRDDLTVLAYRFRGDRICRAERFAAYSEALGERFVSRVLPDSAANPDTAPFFQAYVTTPHSVVTAHLIDEAGQPTIAARDEILDFFTERLLSLRVGESRAKTPTFTNSSAKVKDMSRVSTKNQVTLPVDVMRAAGLRPGDEVTVRPVGDGEVIVAVRGSRVQRHAGIADGIYREGELERLRGEWER